MAQSEISSADPRALVIGAGLGGLAAAMRLGAKGYRVSVLDKLDRVGGRGSSITQDGFRFDLGPTIVTMPDVFEKLWADCGRDFHAEVDLRALEPFYQIRWPDGSTFSACSDEQTMLAEVERLRPSDVRGFKRFLKAAHTRYVVGYEGMVNKPMHNPWATIKVLPTFARLRADRSIYAMVSKYVKDKRLRMALSFHPLFIGGDPTRVTSIYALVAHLEKTYGVHCAVGGVQAIAEAMASVIRAQGGDIRLDTKVDEILLQDGAARAVALADGTQIDAPLIVSNADAGFTYDHLLRNHRKRRWSRTRLRRKRWSMGLFVWYFGTKGTALKWPDVGHHTIINGPRFKGLLNDIFIKGKLADDMSLYVHRPAVTDKTVAPAGDDAFYVLSPVPHLGWDDPVDWQAEEPRYRAKVAAEMEKLIPGFQDHICSEVVFTPETFRERYLSPYGCGFSLEPRILQSAWFRPHNVSEEARGLFLVGAGTHPGAGLPGVVSSAEVLAQLVPDLPKAASDVRLVAE